LTTSARFVGSTTRSSPAPVEVMISTISDQSVALDPCPLFEVRTKDRVGKHDRFATTSIDGRAPGCKTAAVTVTPTQPVTFRVPRRELISGTPFDAKKGSTFDAFILAGMPTARASTTVT
jgi:hypothetical protein